MMHDDLSIRVVFFDAAGTLFRVRGSVAEIYLKYAVQFGFQQKADSLVAIKEAFGRAFREAPPPVFAVTEPAHIKQSERLWWFDIVHNVFYRVGMFERFDDFFDRVFAVFEDPASWELFPETASILKRLKGQGLELGIISNFDSRLFSVMRGLGIADLFDTVTISSLAQAAKPASKIFHLALNKHAVDPEEALHVGDSVRDDLEGAQRAGLRAILLDREGKHSGWEGRCIRTLNEIPDLLD
ncbi:MAG: HAD-IA family hydrolase [Nitrospira sp.]|nr:HAD-IA family hydrolase [Nitrospira sp.]MCP9441025.1 HAD-IA family hydrolase [Nitrospira sp.]